MDGRAALVNGGRRCREPRREAARARRRASRPARSATLELDAAAIELAREALWSGRGGLFELGGTTVFVDVVAPPPQLDHRRRGRRSPRSCRVIAALAGWRSFVVDPRARFATAERFPAAERVVAAWPQEAFAAARADRPRDRDRGAHERPQARRRGLDRRARVRAPGYIGAMGSRRAQATRASGSLAAGVASAELERIARRSASTSVRSTAAETALSIMSEIVALRHGRNGGRLIEARAAGSTTPRSPPSVAQDVCLILSSEARTAVGYDACNSVPGTS